MTRLQQAGTAAGVLWLLICQVVPPITPVTGLGMSRIGLLGFAVLWWTLAPVPFAVTTIAALGAGVLFGALTMAEAFSAPTNWVMWFVIGSFGLSAALEHSGFNRRFALGFLTAPFTRGRPYAFLFMFLLSATLMSGVMSNTVVAVVWLSLATTIYKALDLGPRDAFAETTTIGIAWAANIGGIATPIGSANNPAAMGLLAQTSGYAVSFLTWSVVGTASALVLAAVMLAAIRYLFTPDLAKSTPREALAFVEQEQRRLGPMSTAEKWALGWGGLAIALWLVPDLARVLLAADQARLVDERLGLVVPALLVPVAMCLIPVGRGAGRRPVLTWDVWARGVEWGMVIFVGGVLVIGSAIGAAETGIPAALQQIVGPLAGGLPEYGFVLALTFGVILVTGVISNLVSLSVFIPLGVTLSQGLGIGSPAAVGLVLGLGGCLAHLLPSGTTTNAIVASTGRVRVSVMLRRGFVLTVLHALVLTGFSYPLAKLLLG